MAPDALQAHLRGTLAQLTALIEQRRADLPCERPVDLAEQVLERLLRAAEAAVASGDASDDSFASVMCGTSSARSAIDRELGASRDLRPRLDADDPLAGAMHAEGRRQFSEWIRPWRELREAHFALLCDARGALGSDATVAAAVGPDVGLLASAEDQLYPPSKPLARHARQHRVHHSMQQRLAERSDEVHLRYQQPVYRQARAPQPGVQLEVEHLVRRRPAEREAPYQQHEMPLPYQGHQPQEHRPIPARLRKGTTTSMSWKSARLSSSSRNNYILTSSNPENRNLGDRIALSETRLLSNSSRSPLQPDATPSVARCDVASHKTPVKRIGSKLNLPAATEGLRRCRCSPIPSADSANGSDGRGKPCEWRDSVARRLWGEAREDEHSGSRLGVEARASLDAHSSAAAAAPGSAADCAATTRQKERPRAHLSQAVDARVRGGRAGARATASPCETEGAEPRGSSGTASPVEPRDCVAAELALVRQELREAKGAMRRRMAGRLGEAPSTHTIGEEATPRMHAEESELRRSCELAVLRFSFTELDLSNFGPNTLLPQVSCETAYDIDFIGRPKNDCRDQR
ncbi:hypothetical protein AB1Y20_011096 [Prymnesium parvum]|uniref:Uncharacterized protein n=1 Tax=Prymnesium parvum TaxID=97485 RepID=A0AB34INL8_PRYPA